jgi:arsenate reductase
MLHSLNGYRSEFALQQKSVLFICAHNAARSQMAERYLRAQYGDRYRVFSAGIRASTLSGYAVRSMKEIGIDISTQASKSLEDLAGMEMDVAVVLCEDRAGVCPVYPWARDVVHARFSDPGMFTGNEQEI